MRMRKHTIGVAFGALCVLGLIGCAGQKKGWSQRAGETQDGALAPKWDFKNTSEVRTDMQQLALRVDRIDRLLRDGRALKPQEQEDVVRLLEEMEDISGKLSVTKSITSHIVLEDNILAFREDLVAARRTAAQKPPSYFLAGAITGSCLYCHR